MRSKTIFLFLLLSGLAVHAQTLSTAGQSYLKFYNKTIEKLQKTPVGSMDYEELILDAEKKISVLKKTDPSFDVSAMEAEVKKYKASLSSAVEAKENDWKSAKMTSANLETFLYWSMKEYKNSKTDADFAALDKKVNEQIAALSDFCKTSLKSSDNASLRKIEDHWEVNGMDETQLVSTKKFHEKSEGVEYAIYNFYQIKWIFNKWKAFSAVYPSSETIAEATKKAEEVWNMLGSVEQVKAQAQGAKAKRIADTKMEPAVVNDPQLEARIKSALLKSKFASGKTIVKINIHSSGWTVQKHAITGVTLSRTKGFSAAIKEKDGSCSLLHYVDFKQDYVGGNFAQGYINLGELVEILCENVK